MINSVSKLKVLIINYNSLEDTIYCVNSLISKKIVTLQQIIIIDNCSPDGSGKELSRNYPQINVIIAKSNKGYASAVNMGIGQNPSDYYLVLNPDTYFMENKLSEALRIFTNDSKVGIVGLNLINPDGTLQHSARTFYNLYTIIIRRTILRKFWFFNNKHLMGSYWEGGPFYTDWVLGTGFLVKGEAFKSLGGMDQNYFLYFEDVDLCARMWMNGWKVCAIPSVKIIHAHNRHSKKHFTKAGKTHLKSLHRFVQKFGISVFGESKLSNIRKKVIT